MTQRGLAGKRVLVTGGGTGVGADLARGFAKAGASVVICGRREAPLRAVAQQTGALFLTADVTSEADVKRLFAEAGQGTGEVLGGAQQDFVFAHALLGAGKCRGQGQGAQCDSGTQFHGLVSSLLKGMLKVDSISAVHGLYLGFVFLLHQLAFELHGGGEFLVFCRELVFQ